MSKNEIMFKIITLGDSGVGKTSIIRQYANNIFDENFLSTVGVGFAFKDARIIFEDGKIHVYRDSAVRGEYDISDFSKSPSAVLRRIKRNLE